MGDRKKAVKFFLLAALVLLAALCLIFYPYTLGLLILMSTCLPLSAPFCLLQVALCRRCPYQILRAAPAALSGAGLIYGLIYTLNSYEWASLLGLVILFPSFAVLEGSGLGWLLWRVENQKHK